MQGFTQKFDIILRDYAAASDNTDSDLRRKLFSRAELLRIEVEEHCESNSNSLQLIDVDALNKKIDEFVSKIPLLPAKRRKQWWSPLDYGLRFSGFAAAFVFIGVFASIPVVILKYLDKLLDLDCSHSLSIRLRRSISWYLMYVSGVSQTVLGADEAVSKIESCAILTFAHASNLDGFMISSTCPIPHYALAKKELFVVPFFSWYSLAVGGIPVDRNNRDRAISALQRSTEAVKHGRMCIVVAPEGTRTNTGHLNEFKKGTFHIWEQLKAPIIPVISYGAYDLFPGKSWLNATGTVVFRYLDPILPHEASSRDQMMRLLRKRMLEGLYDTPNAPIGTQLTWPQRIANIVCCSAAIAANVATYKGIGHLLRKHNISSSTAAYHGSMIVFGITAALYVYNVYLIDLISGKSTDRKLKGQ